MLIKLLLAIALLIALFTGVNKFKKLPAEKRKGFLVKALVYGAAALLLIGVATGRMHWVGVIVAALLPLMKFGFFRLLPLWMHKTGGIAAFKTEHLDAKVQIQTGQISGDVIAGPHNGKRIENLAQEELDELLEHYKEHDLRSYYLLKIGRPGPQFQHQQSAQAPSFGNPSRDEALQILGLSGNPSQQDIIAAHRRLINKLHPDRGGSDFLAARVNQARDVLLDGH